MFGSLALLGNFQESSDVILVFLCTFKLALLDAYCYLLICAHNMISVEDDGSDSENSPRADGMCPGYCVVFSVLLYVAGHCPCNINRCTTKCNTPLAGIVPAVLSSELPKCSAMMDSLVYLPLLNNIPDSEWDRYAHTEKV